MIEKDLPVEPPKPLKPVKVISPEKLEERKKILKKARAAKRKREAKQGLPDFMSPAHPKNPNRPMWWIPSAERLVELLRKEYGDVKALLYKAGRNDKEHDRLLFSINEALTSSGNESHLAEWERLKHLYEMTQTERLRQRILSDILAMKDNERKTKLSDFKYFLAKADGAGGVRKSVKEKQQEAANAHIMKELSAITDRMGAPASTETEEDEDCLEADDND